MVRQPHVGIVPYVAAGKRVHLDTVLSGEDNQGAEQCVLHYSF